jgi:hypothetical protein
MVGPGPVRSNARGYLGLGGQDGVTKSPRPHRCSCRCLEANPRNYRLPKNCNRHNTKRHALEIADYLDARIDLDQPLNIHLTGCPNSCAQRYVGDIGLLATKVDVGGDAEAEGYHLIVGGGSGAQSALGREICRGIPADELPRRLEIGLGERMLAEMIRVTRPGGSRRRCC